MVSKQIHHLILGTAGHIDHGKTALVKALTGIDTDRLPEEKQRGMTIELGFAHLQLNLDEQEIRLGIVDVPGHERFIRNMVAGAHGIDIALLVVAADDGIMPQTREHVDILKLLNIQNGIVAITKCDLVEEEYADLVEDDMRTLLAHTPLCKSAMIRVSSLTSRGIDPLKEEIGRVALKCFTRNSRSAAIATVFRLPIDRVFTAHGRGTIVTGSAISGSVCVGDELEVLPSGTRCKVRDLQTHHDTVDRLLAGQRVAMNLSGIDRTQLTRGHELATPGFLTKSQTMDAKLELVPNTSRAVKHMQRVRLCIGTQETRARLRLLRVNEAQSEKTTWIQFLLDVPQAASWGQRFIIREENRSSTLGGGIILRPVARRPRLRDLIALPMLCSHREDERLAEVIRYEHGCQIENIEDRLSLSCRSGITPEKIKTTVGQLLSQDVLVRIKEWTVATATLLELGQQAVKWLQKYHQQHPDLPGCPLDVFVGTIKRNSKDGIGEFVFQELLAGDGAHAHNSWIPKDWNEKSIIIQGPYCRLRAFSPSLSSRESQMLASLIEEYRVASLQPPFPKDLKCVHQQSTQMIGKLIKIASAQGDLVELDRDLYMHRDAITRAREIVRNELAQTSGLTVSRARDLTGSSRKYVVPLLEYLDRIQFTRRIEDTRVLFRKSDG